MILVVAAGVSLVTTLLTGDGESAPPAPGATVDLTGTITEVAMPVQDLTERVSALDEPLGVWFRIADCESGEWRPGRAAVPGSADWDDGVATDEHPFEGGLHFSPSTWDAYRDPGMPEHAGRATPLTQIEVAERVQDDQGWSAWPVCSARIGVT